MPYERNPESLLVLYAELLEQAIHAEASRAAGEAAAGSFVRKQVRGRTYWYLQRSAGGQRRQHYLGPESPALLAAIERAQEQKSEAAEEARERTRLCAMLRAGGAAVPSAAVARVLEILVDAGIFHRGGVLVGTYAFAAYGNLFGVRFDHQSLRTQDVDIAQDPSIGVALAKDAPAVDVGGELLGSELAFHAVPGLDPKSPSTSFKVRGRELRVDFLTPMKGRESNEPVYLPAFQLSAQPLRMLDYLLDDPVQAVVPAKSGLLVQIPDPARFALHKLWVAEDREVAFQAKRRKDLRQASQLLELLLDDRPGDLTLAWEALEDRPKARKRILQALGQTEAGVAGRVGEVLAPTSD